MRLKLRQAVPFGHVSFFEFVGFVFWNLVFLLLASSVLEIGVYECDELDELIEVGAIPLL